MPLKRPVREYFEIVGEKKVRCKLCVPPATTTLCVFVHACLCSCMRGCMRVCVCVCTNHAAGFHLLGIFVE